MGSRFFRHSTLAIAIGLLAQAAQAAPVYEWTGATGNWSLAGNWLGGVAPPTGGDAAATLIMGDAQNLSSSDNNLAGLFSVNLGNGGQLILTTSTESQGLELANDWATARQVNIISTSGLQTRGYTATLNGELLGAGNLSKFGSGALVLNGGGNYSGRFTVYEGSLIVNTDLRTANATVNAGILGGTGAVGDVILAGGMLAPGSLAAPQGRFAMDTLALSAGSLIAFDLGAGGDGIGITGALSRNGATAGAFTFLFNGLDGLQAGQSYDLIDFGSTTLSAADFAYQSANAGLAGSFSIVGNSLMFNVSAVPEPAPGALMLAGLAALGWLARRRRG